MGAQPKNKITRAERGKRRAGNTPSLKKDAKNAKVPLHKQTLMKKFADSSANNQIKKTEPQKTVATDKKAVAPVKPESVTKVEAAAKKAATPKTISKNPSLTAKSAPKSTTTKKPATGK